MGNRPGRRRWIALATGGAIALSTSIALGVPTGAGAAPPAGLTKIKHVVVMMQENRSYDSYFGRLHSQGQPASPAEPTTGNPDPTNPALTIRPFKTTQECTVADLNHSWNGTHQEWAGGAM